MNKDTFELLQENGNIFATTFNLNDTFYYACADSCTIDDDCLDSIEPLIIKYKERAIWAYESLMRGHDPRYHNTHKILYLYKLKKIYWN